MLTMFLGEQKEYLDMEEATYTKKRKYFLCHLGNIEIYS